MFIGRKEYLEDLETLWHKRTSSIVACRGRRRIGKSTLFREFARCTADRYLEIEGLPPDEEHQMTNQDEIDHFVEVLDDQTGCGFKTCTRWYEAFSLLEKQIDDGQRTVILLDEVSWMGQYDPKFAGVLRTAWETLFHRHEKLILVVCGSASGWIKKNILSNTGFRGRFSRDYVLSELKLPECVEFWGEAKNRIDVREILDVLSVTGGVPRYLEEVDPGLSADENIRRMCFLKSGELYKDFEAIFNPLIGVNVPLKRAILERLADGPLSGAELAEKLGRGRNGDFADVLRDLSEGGFITSDPGKNPLTGKDMRIGKYRLRDNYTRFYLKYVQPNKTEIELGTFRYASLEHLPQWDSILGFQFENLVLNNAMELLPHIGIGNATVESAAPYRTERKARNGEEGGCQIDLLIQTPRTAFIVEVKRKRNIGLTVEDEVRRKIRLLPVKTGKSKRAVLVYEGELAKSIEADGYFDALIPARRLLGL